VSTKYYIASKNIIKGVSGNDIVEASQLSSYFELGWELAITRPYLNLMINTGSFDPSEDVVVTSFDRSFLYSRYCKNVITLESFLEKDVDNDAVIDLTSEDMLRKMGSEMFDNCSINYGSKYIDSVKRDNNNTNIDLLDDDYVVKNNNNFICLAIRNRDWVSNRNISDDSIHKIINHYLLLNIDVYVFGKGAEIYANNENIFYASFQELATLLNNKKCLNFITSVSGGGMIRFFTGICQTTIINRNGELHPDHVLFFGDEVDFVNAKKTFKVFPSDQDFLDSLQNNDQ
jgi:hypothetical protein